MTSLLIDDMRDIDADVVARNYYAGIEALKKQRFDILYLDHDLASYDADGNEKTGYHIMLFLEENPEFKPGRISIVSSNPVGRDRMQVVIDRLYSEDSI